MSQRVVLKPVRVSSRQPDAPRRKKKHNNLWKGILVVLLSTGLTTLAIKASDSFENPSALIAGVAGSKQAQVDTHCPPEMAYVSTAEGGYCIDKYEVSAGDTCARTDPANEFETQADLTDPKCLPVSQVGNPPWVNVPLHHAIAICAKVGKRLPTNKEWYRSAIGTPDNVQSDDPSACALGKTGQTHSEPTGVRSACVSSFGVYDMVGNVWEWVDGQVEDGKYGSRFLPNDGYVDEVDVDGVPTKTATTSDLAFGEDYLFVDHSGVRGMIRGGFWSLKEKAGIFDINATIPTSFVGDAVGFRCAKDAS
jgi:formylglycine-generating enzyme required for sulfatase activity